MKERWWRSPGLVLFFTMFRNVHHGLCRRGAVFEFRRERKIQLAPAGGKRGFCMTYYQRFMMHGPGLEQTSD